MSTSRTIRRPGIKSLALALAAVGPADAHADAPWVIHGVELPGRDVTVPLLDPDLPIVTITFNGREMRWRVDTGWQPSIVDRRRATSFRVPALRTIPSPFETAGPPTAIRRVDELRLGAATIVTGQLLDYELMPMSRVLGVRVEGMLGIDALMHGPVRFDFSAPSITLHDPATFAPLPPDEGTPVELVRGLPCVRVTIDGIEALALIDTGAVGALYLTDAFAELHPSVRLRPVIDTASVVGNTGESTRVEERIGDLEAFGLALPGTRYVIGTADTADMDGIDAILGMGVLRNVRLTLDMTRRMLWAESAPQPSVAAQLAGGLDPESTDVIGRSPLMRAVFDRDPGSARAALDAGCDVDGASNNGLRPLVLAAAMGQVAIVRELLARGADVNVVAGHDQTTALHEAAADGHVEVLTLLLESGADKGTRNTAGNTPLHLAALRGQTRAAEVLLDAGAAADDRRPDGATPAMWAASADDVDLLRLLVARGARLDRRSHDLTVLHFAAMEGASAAVRYLVENGLALEAVNADGLTPLAAAAIGGSDSCVDLLLAAGVKPDPPLHARFGSVLVAACESGNVELVHRLLEAGVRTDVVDARQRTAVLVAIETGLGAGVVRALVDAGCDPYRRDERGRAPLTLAARGGHLDIVRVLLKAGGDVDARGEADATALGMACIGGHDEVAAFLIDLGADVNARTVDGAPPLGGAAMSGRADLVTLLLDHGADIDLENTAGMTSLVAAISGLSDACVDLLIERGASVDVRDGTGFAPIHHAASLGRDGAVQSIVAAGVDIDSATADGGTALMLATMRRQADTVAVLLELGADPTITVDGRTALDIASGARDTRIERLLMEALAARQEASDDGAGG